MSSGFAFELTATSSRRSRGRSIPSGNAAGCFAFWASLRRGASPLVAIAGIGSLVGFALALTRVDSMFAGRAYAAYGGIYIAASLIWLWLVEGQRPTIRDSVGAAIAIVGALIIISAATRR